uniref:Saposin B-type domain-containing protein n=1 Tax=Panagrellus redivivus TaxID=6233 RepID=A0A7E4UPQ5_PANRE
MKTILIFLAVCITIVYGDWDDELEKNFPLCGNCQRDMESLRKALGNGGLQTTYDKVVSSITYICDEFYKSHSGKCKAKTVPYATDIQHEFNLERSDLEICAFFGLCSEECGIDC